ncbi:MAG: nucleotide exchange factor GrpE [Slackia isoflavoniconvertens]|nr:nucleotide exchange factor GrpE [Slackia isoflavoniconvertens]
MSKDGKDKAAQEPREIPIDGADEVTEGAAEAAAPGSEAEPAETAEAAEAEADSIEEEAEAVVADAERVAKAEAEAAAMRDKYLRLQAEWDNYRKRTAEEAGEMRVRAAEKLMGDLLPVMDDFERAIAHAEANGDAGLLDGVKAISTKLSESLGKHGLETIDPAGEAFDALEHQAVGQVEDASVPDETVAQVYQKGYRLGKKVIRPAMVTISTGGPKREVESDDAE